jgi:chemotaxis protein CheZ
MSDEKPEATVYRQISSDMREGLKDIYQRISTASKDQPLPATQPDALFLEASSQLDEVLKATEAATMSIMEIVERHLDLQEQNAELLTALREGNANASQIASLEANNSRLGDDLTALLTTLSFQDITGQRIKKVVTALNQIESMVVELYVSSGLIMEGAEKNPEKNVEKLQSEARQAVETFRQNRNELKGPDKDGVSQGAIDDMLSQLGL